MHAWSGILPWQPIAYASSTLWTPQGTTLCEQGCLGILVLAASLDPVCIDLAEAGLLRLCD